MQMHTLKVDNKGRVQLVCWVLGVKKKIFFKRIKESVDSTRRLEGNKWCVPL